MFRDQKSYLIISHSLMYYNNFVFKGILQPIFCIYINTYSVRKWKIYFKNLFFQNIFALIDPFYRYHYIRYFIYSDCMRRLCVQYVQKQPPEEFFKKGVFKSFANSTGKHLSWSLFLIQLQAWGPATLLKRDSNTDAFLWN